MIIEIDQSGRVEYTNKPTVIAGYNKKWQKAVIIPAKDKRQLQKIFRQVDQPRLFNSKVFASLIYYLIEKDYRQITTLVIDREYTGHEIYIKNQIKAILMGQGRDPSKISIIFKEIGKTSLAHKIAITEYRKRDKAQLITTKDILKVI